MKKIIVIVIIIILIIPMTYYRDNLIDLTKIRINIKHFDITSDNLDWNLHAKDGLIEIASVDSHELGYHNFIFLKGHKPYEKLQIYKRKGKLYVYYEEKNVEEKENVLISFPLSFKANKNNTMFYINGELVNDIQFVNGIE